MITMDATERFRLLVPTLAVVVFSLGLGACSSSAGDEKVNHNAADVGDVSEDTSGEDTQEPTCSDALEEDAQEHVLGSWTVGVHPGSGAWYVSRGGEQVLASAGACGGDPIRLRTGQPGVRYGFGAFQVQLSGRAGDADWEVIEAPPHRVEASGEASGEADAGKLALVWERGAAVVRLQFALFGAEDLEIRLDSSDPEHRTGELAWRCGATESFFGLGTQSVGMDLRGRTYPLWTQEQGNGKPEKGGLFPLQNKPEAAYAPMGVLYSSAGYTGLVGHDGYHEIDLCHENPAGVRLRSYPELPSLVLVTGDTPKERVESATRYLGRTTEPPAWVFGPWNDAVGSPERVWDVARTLREHDIPSSAMWTEDWIGGELTTTGFRLSYRWEWDPATYPDLPRDIEELHAQGFAFLAYFNPFIPNTVPTYAEGESQGFLLKKADGATYTFLDPAFRTASMVDLSHPGAEAWLKGYLKKAADELRIDGWMADFAEWLPVDAALASGEDPWLFHNRYPMEWQRIHREALEEVVPREPGEAANNWTFFARSGWGSVNGGTAGLAPTLWGGDQNTDWKYDDGLPTIVPIGAHVGLAGVAIFGSDIAGYSSLNTTNTGKELFLRWSSLGAFHPLMRTHHGGDKCNNWNFDRDPETLAHYRRYAKIHTLLLPFWQNLVEDAVVRGLPIIRHPYLVAPDAPQLWQGDDYQYFLGDDFLVAPVLKEGATTRPVALPGGAWWPLFAGGDEEPVHGPETQAEAGPGEIPVFVRAGTIVPLLLEAVDSFYGAQAEGVTDLTDVAGQFRLALYPDVQGNLNPAVVGEATVSGSGWRADARNWETASVDGVLLPVCRSGAPGLSCISGDTLYLAGENLTVTTESGATLTLQSRTEQIYRIAFGGAAWAELAEATPITDLRPETVSYCEAGESGD